MLYHLNRKQTRYFCKKQKLPKEWDLLYFIKTENSDENTTTNEIKEQSGSQDVKAEIVDIPNLDQNKD